MARKTTVSRKIAKKAGLTPKRKKAAKRAVKRVARKVERTVGLRKGSRTASQRRGSNRSQRRLLMDAAEAEAKIIFHLASAETRKLLEGSSELRRSAVKVLKVMERTRQAELAKLRQIIRHIKD